MGKTLEDLEDLEDLKKVLRCMGNYKTIED